MKNRASGFLKQIIKMLTSMTKAKTMALKSKTRALRTRLIIFSLLRNKNILSTISHKLDALMGQSEKSSNINQEQEQEEENVDDQRKAVVVYNHHNAMSQESFPNPSHYEIEDEEDEDYDDKYPDLTHSLFDLDFEDPGGSVIDIVKNSKEGKGEEFKLEDEIDQVADLFIKRFHRQMRMQKQLSLKRYQDMLDN